jgi:hypothetical protein
VTKREPARLKDEGGIDLLLPSPFSVTEASSAGSPEAQALPSSFI